MRSETRRQRYNSKANKAKLMPVSIATINFSKDANIAYVVRAAACFGADEVCVIGSVLSRDLMNDLSGSTYDYVNVHRFSSPSDFIAYCRRESITLIAFEMPSEEFPAVPLSDYKFNFSKRSCVVVGHETLGVSPEILAHSDRVFIPMPGIGYSLNTSQAGNIALYEAAKQFSSK